MLNQFGALPSKDDLKEYHHSLQWKGSSFSNILPTHVSIKIKDVPHLFTQQFLSNQNLGPKVPIPIITDSFSNEPYFQGRWFGHSVLFLKMEGLNILIDPMFGDNAAPISPFSIRRFSKNTLAIIDTLPQIDLILISHDHYDHLDYKSMMKLKSKTKQLVVALGVKRHLVKWGFDPNIISELDWWQETRIGNVNITFTPSRHFSGRSGFDRNKCLWGGFALTSKTENVWFSGDSGYGDHFKEIGDKLGPFDLGFIECGQYSPLWHDIHLYPEESVLVAQKAKVKKSIPVHWGGFSISQHNWQEPVKRFTTDALKEKVNFILPQLGQIFKINSDINYPWWEQFE